MHNSDRLRKQRHAHWCRLFAHQQLSTQSSRVEEAASLERADLPNARDESVNMPRGTRDELSRADSSSYSFEEAPNWQTDAYFLTFAIAVIAVAACIAFAWDTTRSKKRSWTFQEAHAISQ